MRHIAAAGFAFLALGAQATVLDFSGPVCSASADGSGAFVACVSGGFINRAYGDTAGADVSYQASPGSPN